MKKIALITLILILSMTGRAQQVLLKEVDPVRLVNPEVSDYLQNQVDQKVIKFSDIRPSLNPGEDASGYLLQTLNYYFADFPENIWGDYVNSSPEAAWNSRKINFNILFSNQENKILYPGDDINGIDLHDIIFLNLSFLFGLYKLPMAFEITRIDNDNLAIEFSYLKGNKSEGKQVLKFISTKKGKTIIEHSSYYKSGSFLRDRFLYPYFHKKVTDDFHRNMKRGMVRLRL